MVQNKKKKSIKQRQQHQQKHRCRRSTYRWQFMKGNRNGAREGNKNPDFIGNRSYPKLFNTSVTKSKLKFR